ncbi:response regulator transcription factor [uncultured Nocardioides sp.]|uniref:response regulator n=1 Tax=uncultured Nocardioides sp. TaxID=198441 RepID=UPI002627B14E|nr:response regulator transcription factor [uncultured Nocardioides sp.]
MTDVTVLLVDDDPLVRQALALMLGGQSDLRVVGEAVNGREALAKVRELRPRVVLMDIRMPVMDGLEATRALHATGASAAIPPPRVVVLTTFDADEYVVGAVAAGADGFLLKDTAPADLITAVRRVAAGEPMMSPSATATLVRRVREEVSAAEPSRQAAAAEEALARLTGREREVAVAVGRGLSNAEIGAELHLSVPTVKAHVSRLFDKLGATNRVQIAMTVHDAGLL